MSDIARDKAKRGIELAEGDTAEFAFDLNEFFRTNESGKFIYDDAVNKFLDALTKGEKFPFSTSALRDELKHTFWLLNRMASAKALAKKLKLHPAFKDYEIVLAAGDGKLGEADENAKSFDKVKKAIAEHEKTITLSVGQLTTGVTVPEWTGVLMLLNISSPALYMQAAFCAQNPCLFRDSKGDTYRKQNAYVFDFDPARTLTIFEKFANDLIPATFTDNIESRRQNIKELLNFFPVYGEDESGVMMELDAEQVLTIPRRIHAREVVERGFMSNFLFANIGGIFNVPKEIIDIINNMPAIEEPKKLAPAEIDEDTAKNLNLNDKGEVEIPQTQIVGVAADIFGEKIYKKFDEQITATADEFEKNPTITPKKDELKKATDAFAKPFVDTILNTAKEQYGGVIRKSTNNILERQLANTAKTVINQEYGKFAISDNKLKREQEEKIKAAQNSGADIKDIEKIKEDYDNRRIEGKRKLFENIKQELTSEKTFKEATEKVVETVETEKLNAEKNSIEGSVRDHLRGFSRTIPAFLMAYGDENTTLQNFDSLAPAEVFFEVTKNPQTGEGVTLEQFKLMRDGGEFLTKSGEKRHYDGHLFDEVVFNDAVQEFMKKRKELANYFDTDQKEDIFDFIPPQRTNQIFTPKKVVKDMADKLESENPGCFDDPNATFADLYMKSGMYIAEIVKRLYNSENIKAIYKDDNERLNHIEKISRQYIKYIF